MSDTRETTKFIARRVTQPEALGVSSQILEDADRLLDVEGLARIIGEGLWAWNRTRGDISKLIYKDCAFDKLLETNHLENLPSLRIEFRKVLRQADWLARYLIVERWENL